MRCVPYPPPLLEAERARLAALLSAADDAQEQPAIERRLNLLFAFTPTAAHRAAAAVADEPELMPP